VRGRRPGPLDDGAVRVVLRNCVSRQTASSLGYQDSNLD
jgi:hypothetical protein